MKILQMADYYHSGDGHPLNNISERLKARGHEVVVYTSTLSILPTKQDKNDIVKIIRFKGFKFAGKAIYPGIIQKLLFQEKVDVVHSHIVGFFSTFVAGYLKKIKKYPLVVLADFNVAGAEPSLLKKPYEWLFRKIPVKMADVITTFTEQEKEGLSKTFDIDKEKIVVLPIGVDYEKFSSKPQKDLRKKLDLVGKFVILNVSYVYPVRNLEAIIKAVKSIDCDNAVFLHIGDVLDHDYKTSLDKLVDDLEINDKVIFLENIPREEIYDYYKIADVFIQPGPRDSYAIPVLEAMASGIPVIAARTGIASEVIKEGESGFFMNGVEDLTEKVKLLINDPNLIKDIGANSQKIAKKFDWDIIIDRLEDIYVNMIKE